jgi:iron complex outermembrane receptor protein
MSAMIGLRAFVVSFLLASLPATLGAQNPLLLDFSVEELMRMEVEPVFGASKRLQPVTQAPASVTIVTRDEIARYGYRTLADVLRSVRGFQVTYDRNYSYLGARGFARPGDFNTRILLLVDGHRINDNVYESAQIGEELGIDAFMFERVEIVRGPSSSLYGTSAFFAVVNVIMRKGADLNGIAASADTGSFGMRGARAAFGHTRGNTDFVFSAGHRGSDGPKSLYYAAFDAPETNHGVALGLDDEEASQFFGRVKVATFTLTGAFGQRSKGVPTASYFTVFNDPSLRTTDARGFVDGEYARTVKGAQLMVRGYWDRYHYTGSYPYASDQPDIVQDLDDYAIGVWAGTEARLTRDLPGRQTLTVGGEFRDNIRQAQGSTYDGSPENVFATEGSSTVSALYAQDDLMLHQTVHLNLGARYDSYAGASRVTPRAALIVTPSETQAFKYLFGTAFRAPNAFELDYYTDGVRDEALRPESVSSHEVVWEQYAGTWLRTTASFYRNRVSDLLALVEDVDQEASLKFTNRGGARGTGLELEGEWRFKRLEGLSSYTWQRTTDLDTGERLTNSPRHTGSLRFSTPALLPGSTVAFETQYVGRRTTLGGSDVDPAWVSHLTLIEPIGHRIDLVANIRNIMNNRVADPGSEEHIQDIIEQDGRTFTVGLRWRYGKK